MTAGARHCRHRREFVDPDVVRDLRRDRHAVIVYGDSGFANFFMRHLERIDVTAGQTCDIRLVQNWFTRPAIACRRTSGRPSDALFNEYRAPDSGVCPVY